MTTKVVRLYKVKVADDASQQLRSVVKKKCCLANHGTASDQGAHAEVDLTCNMNLVGKRTFQEMLTECHPVSCSKNRWCDAVDALLQTACDRTVYCVGRFLLSET